MKSNAKRLYDHYVEVGNTMAAEDMLKKYPEFGSKPEPVVSEEKPKAKKTKKSSD